MQNRNEEGRTILRKLIGDEDFARRDGKTNAFNVDFNKLSEEFAFASVWSRPGLDWKTRSFLCIAVLSTLGLWGQLRFHIHSALNNGASVSELKEVMIHISVYCGLPAAAEAGKVMEAVFVQRGIAPEPISRSG